METASIDEARELLYGHPIETFVAERDALVKAIRAGGDRALANDVKALRKPSAVAAEVNQIVRADPDGVDLILQAAALLRSAQDGALEGTSVNVSELQQQYRAAIQALAQSATSRRVEVRAALEAATIDEASNEDLRAGCLVAVPTPVSVLGSASPSPAGPSDAGASKPKAKADQPIDELEQRRALRRAGKNAEEAADKKAAVTTRATAEKAAAAAVKKAAAEEEQKRKAVEKERKKQHKDAQKRHRDAVRAHLLALDAQEDASLAVERAEQDIADTDAEIEAAEQALAALRVRREQTVAEHERYEQAMAEAHLRADEAQAAVDALAAALASLEDAVPE